VTVRDPTLAKRIAGLRYEARRAIDGLLTGMHASPHRGASVVFVEHREYRPGDELKRLDWRAFARTDRHVVKHFEQESELRATLVLDQSGSMLYPTDASGSSSPSKLDHAATLLAALSLVLSDQGDAVGVTCFSAEVLTTLPARTRRAHLDAVMKALSESPPLGGRTNLANALGSIAERNFRRGLVAIATDLLDSNERALEPIAAIVARGHDVVVFHVLHPDELDFPFDGPHRFVGLEGEPEIEVDVAQVSRAYRQEIDAFLMRSERQITSAGARYVLARTDEPIERTLAMVL